MWGPQPLKGADPYMHGCFTAIRYQVKSLHAQTSIKKLCSRPPLPPDEGAE